VMLCNVNVRSKAGGGFIIIIFISRLPERYKLIELARPQKINKKRKTKIYIKGRSAGSTNYEYVVHARKSRMRTKGDGSYNG